MASQLVPTRADPCAISLGNKPIVVARWLPNCSTSCESSTSSPLLPSPLYRRASSILNPIRLETRLTPQPALEGPAARPKAALAATAAAAPQARPRPVLVAAEACPWSTSTVAPETPTLAAWAARAARVRPRAELAALAVAAELVVVAGPAEPADRERREYGSP